MSFFEKLKGAILGTQEKNTANIFITDKRYIPTYTIEDWQPKIKMPEYDPLFSLNKYLESIDLPRQTVQKVMSSKNPFGEAKNLFNGQTEKVDWSDMCWRETVRMERWIKVLSLWEAPTERILESTFMYLLLRLGWECHWDTLKQRALNPDGLNYALEACKNNDYSKLLKIVDSDILSCFALAHIRSGRNLTEIVDSCFIYLDMNTTHNGSAQGSFYNLYGKAQIKGLIGKIIESAYIQNKFSLKKLFFISEKYEVANSKSFKYDFSRMKIVNDIYIPTADMKEMIISDILSLNSFFTEAKALAKKIPLYSLSQQEILFFFGKDIPYEHHFCHFTYTPNTATGKLSKYPFTLRFNCQKGKITFTGSINYLSNNSIGKISITIFDIKDTTQINIAVKDGQLRIIKIEHSDKKNYMQTLYNYNSK